MRKRGYVNTIGYVLILENGDTMQFSTEEEADEYIKEKENESNTGDKRNKQQ